MTEWKEYTVQDLIDLNMIEEPMDGNHGGIHPKTTDYVTVGVPFIMANNLVDGRVDLENCSFITEEQANSLRKGFAHPGDVLLTHKATMGRTAIVPDKYPVIILTPQVTYYRIKKDINKRYLKYYFDSLDFQNTLSSWANSGSTRAYLGITAQHKLPVVLPPLETQDKIASILSAIDDKIENNKQINRNLSKQADAIYKERFIINPDEEWPIGRLSDLITVKYGKDHKKLEDGSIPCYGSGGVMRYVEMSLYDQESVLIPRKGTLNNVMYMNTPFWSVDTMFYTMMKVPNAAKFVFHFVKEKDLLSMNAGSAVPSMTTDILNAMELVIPSEEVLAQFEEDVQPLYKAIQENEKENIKLAELRDALLPKLMSGEVDVSDIQI